MINTLASLQNKRVLVVDDEAMLCEIMGSELSLMGCEVVEKDNLQAAFEALEGGAPFDVIVSDVRMPGGGGSKLLDYVIGKFGQKPRVLFVTGLSDISPDEAYDRGVVAILTKPFALEDLSAAVLKSLPEPLELAQIIIPPADHKVEYQIKAANLKAAIKDGLLSVARGGFFFKCESQFPKSGDRVFFKLEFTDASESPIQGTGICRWSRRETTGDLPLGYAVEFESIDDGSAKTITELLGSSPSNSYLPRR